jgi:lipoprotein-releasing system ATP-binding protein
MSESLIQTRDLRKNYDNGAVQALGDDHCGVSLEISAGEFVSISGPSGSGKSTLLQLLGGLDVPTSGDVRFKGSVLGAGVDLDTYRLRHVGFVFQAFHLLPALRAIENVQIPWIGTGVSRRDGAERAEALLREMGLEHRLYQYPGQLSAGERQRVAIARSLANDPEILLADEPTGNLDSVNTAKIMDILTDLQARRGMTLIVVTHEDSIAESAPRHIRMRDGRIVS